MMVTKERETQLRETWWNETDEEWREDLTQEEFELVDSWDAVFSRKIARMAQDILDRSK